MARLGGIERNVISQVVTSVLVEPDTGRPRPGDGDVDALSAWVRVRAATRFPYFAPLLFCKGGISEVGRLLRAAHPPSPD